jgi:hypothetical protein
VCVRERERERERMRKRESERDWDRHRLTSISDSPWWISSLNHIWYPSCPSGSYFIKCRHCSSVTALSKTSREKACILSWGNRKASVLFISWTLYQQTCDCHSHEIITAMRERLLSILLWFSDTFTLTFTTRERAYLLYISVFVCGLMLIVTRGNLWIIYLLHINKPPTVHAWTH